ERGQARGGLDEGGPALVLPGGQGCHVGGDPVRVAGEVDREHAVDVVRAVRALDGLAGVDGGAVDAVVHLAGDGSGQLALTLVEALLRGEHRVVQGRAGQRDTGCAR